MILTSKQGKKVPRLKKVKVEELSMAHKITSI